MKKLLIIGCGYIGKAVAQFYLKQNWEVTGWVHSQASAKTLEDLGIKPYVGDATKLENWHYLPQVFDLVLYCAAAGRRGDAATYRDIYLHGVTCASQWLSPEIPLLFTSSTSVYPQNGGEWVTESSWAEPLTETGQFLRQAEKVVLTRQGTVLRLSGIYGPGRNQMLARLRTRLESGEKGESRWINHIFLDDIVQAIVLLFTSQATGVYNGCDNQPVTSYEVIDWLAQKLGKPLPLGLNLQEPVLTQKRVNNTKLRQQGWIPSFPTYREGYSKLLD